MNFDRLPGLRLALRVEHDHLHWHAPLLRQPTARADADYQARWPQRRRAAHGLALAVRVVEADLGDEFGRERLGYWDDPTGEDDLVGIEDEVWEALEDQKSNIVGEVTFGLDVEPKRRWSSIIAAGGAGMAGPAVLMAATTRLVPADKRGLAMVLTGMRHFRH